MSLKVNFISCLKNFPNLILPKLKFQNFLEHLRSFFERMNLANLFEGYADTALAAWNDPKSKSADQKSSNF